MKKITNTRTHNSKIIITELMLSNNGLSLQEISNKTSLHLSTIKRICDTLVESNIIIFSKENNNKVGRTTNFYQINGEYAHCATILISSTSTQLYIFNFNLELINYEKYKFVSIHETIKLVDEFIKNTKLNILYLTIVVPGYVDKNNNTIILSKTLDINTINIGDEFTKQTNIPTTVENNVNILANKIYIENNKKYENFVVLLIGKNGLGAGVFINNKLHRGHYGAAGEIGHIFYKPLDEKCYCGNYGCYEQHFKRAKSEDEVVELFLHLYQSIFYFYNPEIIFISGEFGEVLYKHNKTIQEHIEDKNIFTNIEYIDINDLDFAIGGAIGVNQYIINNTINN